MSKWKEHLDDGGKKSRVPQLGNKQGKKRKYGQGFFANDEKMPIYSDREFAACSPLVSLQIDIETTINAKDGTIVTNREIITLQEARLREKKLEAEYHRIVREETLAQKPDATEQDIAIRI